MIEIMGVKCISSKEASALYGYSTSWFQRRRYQKLPPPFLRLQGKGKIYYPIDKLEKWFRENIIEIE